MSGGWKKGLTQEQLDACLAVMAPQEPGYGLGWWIRRTPSVRNPPTSLELMLKDAHGAAWKTWRIT
jgi:hypothetical protein